MTGKVVKGTLWTVGGQALPMAAVFVTTPFVIRMLGAEGYGVLALTALVPAVLGFADLGMGTASTKFGSEAFVHSKDAEAAVMRSAALVGLLSSLPFAAALYVFSDLLVAQLNVPEHLHRDASLGLKFASVTLLANFLSNIFNSPQLARLRMDLNASIGAGARTLGVIATPVIIYLGGGISGALAGVMAASLIGLLVHILVSQKLLGRRLFATGIERPALPAMLKFGGALAIAALAGLLLVNIEKFVLARVASVAALAHYSVAFTFAMLASTFSAAMATTLLPAFSQLLAPGSRQRLESLYSRCVRATIVLLLPALAIMLVVARPVFTIWAGEEFGRESTLPFYVILAGLFFNISILVPGSLIIAYGRTDALAKMYWIELFPYIAVTTVLATKFGAVGAAAAWSLRVLADAAVVVWLTRRIAGLSMRVFEGRGGIVAAASLVLLLPVGATLLSPEFPLYMIILLPLSVAVYSLIIWKQFLRGDERAWLKESFAGALR